VDVLLFTRTERISNDLYNKGLAKTRVMDYSGALECLAKSVAINKDNIMARNLLGLVQYEMGRVGDALKHWTISTALQKDDTQAAEYIAKVHKNGRTLEKMNRAIEAYNQALDDVRAKSDDMAIIKLKKAVDNSPRFVDALNLLAFCYYLQNNRDLAGITAERVLALDANNTIALNFFKEMNPGRATPTLRGGNRKSTSSSDAGSILPYKKVTLHERRQVHFHFAAVVCWVIGALCMAGILYVLALPAINRNWEAQVNAARTDLVQATQLHGYAIAELEQDMRTLHTEIARLTDANQVWEMLYSEADRINQIIVAEDLILHQFRGREGIEILNTIPLDGLPPDIVERALYARGVAYGRMAGWYLSEGRSAYTALDFQKARVDLERAYYYNQDNLELLPEILYWLAFTYSQDIDIPLAIQLFERFFDEFPNAMSNAQRNLAMNRLNAIR
jgi:tetratricopeptide (TPR) repeat protein